MKSSVNVALLFIGLGLVLFIFLAWFFSNIFLYFVIAIVISAVLRPLTKSIAKTQFFGIKTPRVMAVFGSLLVFVFLISLFVLLFIPLVSEQVKLLGNIDYSTLYDRITLPLSSLEDYLIETRLVKEEKGFIVNVMEESFTGFISDIEIGNLLNEIISFTGSFFVGIMAVAFITFFLLSEMPSMKKKAVSLIPNQYFEMSIAVVNKVERLLSNYLLGLLLQMVAIFSMASLGLSILGIKYSLTIAVFAAVANLIPYLGPILGATFGILVGVSTTPELNSIRDYLVLVIEIVAVFSVVQVTDNMLLQPLIFSKSVKAHPLEIFIIIFAGASLAGIPGMIAAIPVYTVIRVSFTQFYEGFRSYGIFKDR